MTCSTYVLRCLIWGTVAFSVMASCQTVSDEPDEDHSETPVTEESTDARTESESGTAVLDLGDPDDERAHDVEVSNAKRVGKPYPDQWVMATRASGYEDGHEPYRAADGNTDTSWRVTGRPEDYDPDGFLKKDNWFEIVLNEPIRIRKLSIDWLGDHRYDFRIFKQPWSDLRRKVFESTSNGGNNRLETYTLSEPVTTRTVRIMFRVEEEDARQGIREIRIGGLSWPGSYPMAAYDSAPVQKIERPYKYHGSFHRFNPFLIWPHFNYRRVLADGGTARRILNTKAFEGGHVDFDIAVRPEKPNWITLKLWESHEQLMTERGNTIALEAFRDNPGRNRRWFMPAFVTEKRNMNHEWYGKKPRPGRWVYAHYRLHPDVVGDRSSVRLRLQGVGNDRRDEPMLEPAPPVYQVISHSRPFFGTRGPAAN